MKKRISIILVLFAICVTSIFAWYYINNIQVNNPVAKIYQNGILVKEVKLNTITGEYELVLTTDSGLTNTILIKHGEIGMIHADCPDQVCVKTGFIRNGIKPIVCLPHRVEIIITAENDEAADIVAG